MAFKKWSRLPWVVMCTPVSVNASQADSLRSCFTTRYVLEALGWYPKEGSQLASLHESLATYVRLGAHSVHWKLVLLYNAL